MSDARSLSTLARTPPMGWNSWNHVHCYDLTEQVVRDTADAIVARGLREAGYEYIVIDDCWQGGRDAAGRLFAHPERFPSGIAALAGYVHERGLKLGIYGVPGSETCANFYDGYPIGGLGSIGREPADAATFAEWKVDFLKYDWCRADETDGLERREAFARMRDAIATTGRPMLYAISEYGVAEPWRWGRGVAHQWRTTQDIMPTWESIVRIIDAQAALAAFAGPGGWNDPDMLQFGNGDLTLEQNRSHFTMWCMLAAPLFLGTDIAALDDAHIDVLTDPVLMEIAHDPLGRQAVRVMDGPVQLWVRTLATGATIVACFNPFPEQHQVRFGPRELGVASSSGGLLIDGDLPCDLREPVDIEVPPFAVRLARYDTTRASR